MWNKITISLNNKCGIMARKIMYFLPEHKFINFSEKAHWLYNVPVGKRSHIYIFQYRAVFSLLMCRYILLCLPLIVYGLIAGRCPYDLPHLPSWKNIPVISYCEATAIPLVKLYIVHAGVALSWQLSSLSTDCVLLLSKYMSHAITCAESSWTYC